MLRARKFKELETAIGYRFKNQALLATALTHASVRTGKGRAPTTSGWSSSATACSASPSPRS